MHIFLSNLEFWALKKIRTIKVNNIFSRGFLKVSRKCLNINVSIQKMTKFSGVQIALGNMSWRKYYKTGHLWKKTFGWTVNKIPNLKVNIDK